MKKTGVNCSTFCNKSPHPLPKSTFCSNFEINSEKEKGLTKVS